MQLAIHHERAVIRQQRRHRRGRQFSCLIRITQQEFSRSERGPRSIRHQLALPWLRTTFYSHVFGVSETVCKSEMLAGRGLAIVDLGGRILGVEDERAAALFDYGIKLAAS